MPAQGCSTESLTESTAHQLLYNQVVTAIYSMLYISDQPCRAGCGMNNMKECCVQSAVGLRLSIQTYSDTNDLNEYQRLSQSGTGSNAHRLDLVAHCRLLWGLYIQHSRGKLYKLNSMPTQKCDYEEAQLL